MVCAGHVLAAALVLIQLFDVHILAVSGGSVCASDLYCNAMQLDVCGCGSICGTVCNTGR